MLKKTLSLLMVIVLLQIGTLSGVATSRGDNSETQISMVKADIAKRGLGEKAIVRVKLRNEKELKGYISEAGDDRFTLTISRINESVPVAYSDVVEVKNPNALSSKVLLVLGVGVMATGSIAIMASGW